MNQVIDLLHTVLDLLTNNPWIALVTILILLIAFRKHIGQIVIAILTITVIIKLFQYLGLDQAIQNIKDKLNEH